MVLCRFMAGEVKLVRSDVGRFLSHRTLNQHSLGIQDGFVDEGGPPSLPISLADAFNPTTSAHVVDTESWLRLCSPSLNHVVLLEGAFDMTGRHGHRSVILLNGNLLRVGLCLLVIGMSASCTSLSTPGNSAGVCSAMKPGGNGWAYEANKYLIKSVLRNDYVDENGVIPSTSLGSQSKCDSIDRDWHTVVEGEYALTVPNNIVFMTTSENICRSRPTIRIHRFVGHGLNPALEARLRAKRSTTELDQYTELTSPFYVGSHNAEWIRRPNGIEKHLLLVKELIAKQCGDIPDEIRVSGRLTELPQRDPKSMAILNTYASHEIYAGTYYPHVNSNTGEYARYQPRVKIVHDDEKMASVQYALAVARLQRNEERFRTAQDALGERMKSSPEAKAIMGIVTILLMGHMANPCNNPDLSERPYYCK